MYLLEESSLNCPYCAETITIDIDCSVPEQTYIEDCHVCCRPITLLVRVDESGTAQVQARHENE